MKILLLSAYDAYSHRYWHKGLVKQLHEFSWTVLTLPPRFFSWRFRGNPLSWAYTQRELLEQQYDCLIVTSMTDLTTLRGLVPSLTKTPTIAYFHENQFAYPMQSREMERERFHFCMQNMYTALSADQVIFNSRFNERSFFEGLSTLLKRMPDCVPKGIEEEIKHKTKIIPVPLQNQTFRGTHHKDSKRPLSILWNHRWEFDKAPDRFFHALQQLSEEGESFRLHVVGQSFRKIPSIFETSKQHLKKHIDTWGYIKNVDEYCKLIQHCDVVVSTALHEFQGLALLEAVHLGCYPLVPNRLAYQEFIPHPYRYESFPNDAQAEQRSLLEKLRHHARHPNWVRDQAPLSLEDISWNNLKARYKSLVQDVCHNHKKNKTYTSE